MRVSHEDVCLKSTCEARDEYHDTRDVFLIIVSPRHCRCVGTVSSTYGVHLRDKMTSPINLGLRAMRADLSTTFGRIRGDSQCHPDDAADICLYVDWCIDTWRSRSAVGNRCCNMILLFELIYECVSCAAFCIPLDNEGSIMCHKLILLEEVFKGHTSSN